MKLFDVVNGPWAITPDMLQEIQHIYTTHARGNKIAISEVEKQVGRPLANERDEDFQVIDGVAIINIQGPLVKKMNMFSQVSGGSSFEMIKRDFLDAINSSLVVAIILDIDSPGGTVSGTPDLAELIYANRGRKPIVAWTDGMIASAAYWIAAAADSVYISSEVTMVGSIGVVVSHVDISRAEKIRGVKTTQIAAGKYKTIASKHEPLSGDGRADIQDKVDYLYGCFIDAVAAYRGVDARRVVDQMAEGRIFIGKQAITAGLVDGVSSFDQLVFSLATSDEVDPDTSADSATAELIEQIAALDPDALMAEHSKALWDKDEALRSEFGDNFESFLAYKKHSAAGSIKISSKV